MKNKNILIILVLVLIIILFVYFYYMSQSSSPIYPHPSDNTVLKRVESDTNADSFIKMTTRMRDQVKIE